MSDFTYETNVKKPVDKEWVQHQFENFWLKIKDYIDTNSLHIEDGKVVFGIGDNAITIATIPN